MKSIKIEGYLVQKKLEDDLNEIIGSESVGPEKWLGREIPVDKGSKSKWDMGFIDPRGETAVVEFDGDGHYRDGLYIKRDHGKDALANLQKIKVIRIPYWIQLTTETLKFYTGLEANILQDFPHGFITTKYFPASFCELGIHRFRKELETLPIKVKEEVLSSLEERSKEYGKQYVLPEFLYK